MKISSKNGKNSDLSRHSKIGFDDFFKHSFYVSFDILISTSRTTLIFWQTHSLMFEECFRYLQCVFKMIFMLLKRFEIKGNVKMSLKKSPNLILKCLERSEFFPFWRKFLFQKAPGAWKIIFNTRWYLKHFSNFKEYVSRKIRVLHIEKKISTFSLKVCFLTDMSNPGTRFLAQCSLYYIIFITTESS